MSDLQTIGWGPGTPPETTEKKKVSVGARRQKKICVAVHKMGPIQKKCIRMDFGTKTWAIKSNN